MTGQAIDVSGLRIEIDECDLDTDADIALDEAYAELDADELARAAGFVFKRDRDRYVRAHGRLRRKLGAFLGSAPSAVAIAVSDGGKPRLADPGAHFNLSHSGPRAVIAISERCEVGIDVEVIDRTDGLAEQLDDMAKACLTPAEQLALAAVPAGERLRYFLSYWTAKEARMKLTGEGLMLEPQEVDLELADGWPVGFLRPAEPPARLQFVRLSDPMSICCVAIRDGAAEPHG